MEDYPVIVEEQEQNKRHLKTKKDQLREAALKYHSRGRKGKIEVVASKPCFSQYDLTLAYTPGVAQPCLEIQKDEHLSRKYTAKGNLVAVVSNGTAVLGLGNIGALAGKPVMEGKGVLFKRFADIDVFDIEIDSEDPDVIIDMSYGMGQNQRDVSAIQALWSKFSSMEAVRTKRVHVVSNDIFLVPGPRVAEAVRILASIIHGSEFE